MIATTAKNATGTGAPIATVSTADDMQYSYAIICAIATAMIATTKTAATQLLLQIQLLLQLLLQLSLLQLLLLQLSLLQLLLQL